MPERVHIRFGESPERSDTANTVNEAVVPSKLSSSSQTIVLDHGRKRKRPGGHAVEDADPPFRKANVALQMPKPLSAQDELTAEKHDAQSATSKTPDHELQRRSDRQHVKNPTVQNKPAGQRMPPRSHKPSLDSLANKRRQLLEARKRLPIWPHAQKIRQSLHGAQDVMLLVGETGSGKSTQVPQFLLDESWCKSKGCIAITQPRRVAAISLAKRVAEEMGSPLGASSPASKVGYSVRFDTSVSPSTRIKFLTEGMLLQELLRDPWLKQYNAVIVDEVHERSVNVDLLLGFLRNLIRGDKSGRDGRPLKVVVMSATADVQKLHAFFEEQQPSLPIPHTERTSKLTSGALSDGYASSAIIKQTDKDNMPSASTNPTQHTTSVCYIEGRQYPVSISYLPEPTQDFVEAALKTIFQIHLKEPLPGDVLVFLTGQDTVEGLERLINDYAESMDPKVPKILTLPLFAALPQTAQQRIFYPAPPKTRKIVLSTNIAETSVTVPGVRFVIDCGKHKVKQFRNKLGLDSLLVKPISRSSAIQRAGRAGREAPGKCMRLYPENDFNALEKVGRPEILRCDLAQAVVTMKARGVDDVVGFPWLDPPPREALEKALLQLFQLGALNDDGRITEIGSLIAKLPLSPTLGRVLIEAAKVDKDCIPEVIDILAALSVENIFLNVLSEEKREAAEAARGELYRREGDHLTLLTAVRSYSIENTDRRKWADKYFVSHRAMQNVMDIRKQLTQLCKSLKLLPADSPAIDALTPSYTQTEAENTAILQCILSGFASNTARLMPDGSYRTLMGNQTVAIHPSSVLFGKKVEAIAFTEFVFTNKSYARGCSSVRLAWIDEVLQGL